MLAQLPKMILHSTARVAFCEFRTVTILVLFASIGFQLGCDNTADLNPKAVVSDRGIATNDDPAADDFSAAVVAATGLNTDSEINLAGARQTRPTSRFVAFGSTDHLSGDLYCSTSNYAWHWDGSWDSNLRTLEDYGIDQAILATELNMLPKAIRRHSVRFEGRSHRGVLVRFLKDEGADSQSTTDETEAGDHDRSEEFDSADNRAVESADESKFSLVSGSPLLGQAPSGSDATEPGSQRLVKDDLDKGELAFAAQQDDSKERELNRALVLASEEEKNQKIATDWPKPWGALFITGQQHGYIEPCGCTGLENQKGGLNRRETLRQQLLGRGWDLFPIDAGNQVRRLGPQAEIKFQRTNEALRLMKYQAVAFGTDDLKLKEDQLLLSLFDAEGNSDSPFVSANVFFEKGSTPSDIRTIDIAGRKIGITTVTFPSKAVANVVDLLTIEEPDVALQSLVPKFENGGYDQKILIVHGSIDQSRELGQKFPFFDFVVTAGGFGEPTYKPEQIEGSKAKMIQVGVKGMYVGLLGFFDDPDEPFRYQRIALSSQFEDSPNMTDLFSRYQDQLKELGLKRLGAISAKFPEPERQFVGSTVCGDCHTTAYEIWESTPHSHATTSIISPPERGGIERHFDPECLSCHVTGWNPQRYFPYESGYESLEKTAHLQHNGCENCHGPGSVHVAAENGDIEATDQMIAKFREQMVLPLAKAEEKCMTCHDLDNSPDFHQEGAFEEYWEQVKHYGKD